MKRLALAVQLLTIFRLKKDLHFGRGDLSASMAYFPLVGAFQGLILAGACALLGYVVPYSIVAAFLLVILTLTNAGLHLDGFADTVDGLAGGASAEERLKIMKGSATGAVGAVFVVFILLVKYLAIYELPPGARTETLIFFPASGRWTMVLMGALSGYARKDGGLGEAYTGVGAVTLAAASLFIAVISLLTLGANSFIILAALFLSVYLAAAFFRKKLGGVTGDVFGFQNEIAEAFALLLILSTEGVFGWTQQGYIL